MFSVYVYNVVLSIDIALGSSPKPTVNLVDYFEPNVLVLERGTPFIIENIPDNENTVRMFAVSAANGLDSMHSLVLTHHGCFVFNIFVYITRIVFRCIFLTTQNFIHGDFKASQLCTFRDAYSLKLIDLDSSVLAYPNPVLVSTDRALTQMFASPEVWVYG